VRTIETDWESCCDPCSDGCCQLVFDLVTTDHIYAYTAEEIEQVREALRITPVALLPNEAKRMAAALALLDTNK